MKVTIDIPKEYEDDFTQDRFAEPFSRIVWTVGEDVDSCCDSCRCGRAIECGSYEYRFAEMLAAAFAATEEHTLLDSPLV